ncbi:type II toxin-antitoxin system HipA family toxin [Parahaliea mediterranea]|uniref:HipA domain-containing protein n=1 Tax=Parahaliea mediterranea TaxID=651086 RepID=A0A939DFN1_9GAMM|nr:HipA domain-containing protein [Parahaliea mediterranea]MBN7796647.1 HipA domain-containing protein [Parahaliea mediterranea]
MAYCKISLKEVPRGSKYEDYHDAAFKKLFGSLKVSPVLPFSRSEFKQDSVKYTKGMSISGVHQKLSLIIDANGYLSPVNQGGEFILKPSPEEFPFAAENEHAAMLISDLLGIDTAHCGLVAFSDGELAYVTKRFDRLANGQKRHQEDLLQGFNMQSDRKYDKSYEEAGRLVFEMTDGKKSVVSDYLRRVVYAYLIGNSDLHLKNLSLQKNEDNKTHFYDKLSPNYDCLFTDTYESLEDAGFFALDLFKDGETTGEYDHYGYPTGYDFLELCRRLDIPTTIFAKFVDLIVKRKSEVIEMINRSFMPEKMKEKALETVEDRLRVMQVGAFE